MRDSNSKNPRSVKAVNLSSGGMLIEVTGEVLPEGSVEITLERRGTPGSIDCLETVGRVVRVERLPDGGRTRVAIAFENPLREEVLTRHVMIAKLSRPGHGGTA